MFAIDFFWCFSFWVVNHGVFHFTDTEVSDLLKRVMKLPGKPYLLELGLSRYFWMFLCRLLGRLSCGEVWSWRVQNCDAWCSNSMVQSFINIKNWLHGLTLFKRGGSGLTLVALWVSCLHTLEIHPGKDDVQLVTALSIFCFPPSDAHASFCQQQTMNQAGYHWPTAKMLLLPITIGGATDSSATNNHHN